MRIRWLYFYCFFFVLCHSVSSVKHSLELLVTAASGVPNIPEFTGAMMLDGIQMGYCESNNKILEPRQDWVKKMLANLTWLLEMHTQQCFVVLPETFGKRISSLKEQFQSEGVHILQMREGCEWNEKTGKVTGFLQYAYNGEGFLDFDLKTLTWIALKREAAITKQEWDADSDRTKANKKLLTNIYPEWIKKFLYCGESMMQRTVPPSMSLLQKTSSSPVSCHATGFYPDRAVMFWRKDGEEIHEGVDHGEILPNHDGTFQISVDLNVSSVKSEDWRRYDCVFQFSDVENNTSTKLDKAVIRTNREKPSDMTLPIIPAVVVFVLIIIVAAAGFAVYKKKKVSERRPTSSPDNNDEQRNGDRLIE